jgi:haloalkane dehalogenase
MHASESNEVQARALPAFREHRVPHAGAWLYAREWPGEGPTLLLMHGFPDNLHLYDELIPHLGGRHVVAFDFMGWGRSGRPEGYPFSADSQGAELDGVVRHLRLGTVVLVAHDASGPPAIDWALAHRDRLAGLVLLNTYYGAVSGLRAPYAILLFSTPFIRRVARVVSQWFGGWLFRRLYFWQVGMFIDDAARRQQVVRRLYRQFEEAPTAHRAFFALNEDLLATVRARTRRDPELRTLTAPVRIVFGANDRFLNPRVARAFHQRLPRSELFLLDGANHFVQVDAPQRVAALIRSLPQALPDAAASAEPTPG